MNLSFLDERCERRPKKASRAMGVFARAPIAKDALVAVWGGRVAHRRDLAALARSDRFTQSVMQIDDELYIVTVGSDEDCDLFNHSCNPNW